MINIKTLMKATQQIRVTLPVTITKQGKRFVIYTPALDLSTSGKDLKEVQKRFNEITEIFFEELIEKNKLDQVLTELGWIKVKKQWEPPETISQKLLKFNIPVTV